MNKQILRFFSAVSVTKFKKCFIVFTKFIWPALFLRQGGRRDFVMVSFYRKLKTLLFIVRYFLILIIIARKMLSPKVFNNVFPIEGIKKPIIMICDTSTDFSLCLEHKILLMIPKLDETDIHQKFSSIA